MRFSWSCRSKLLRLLVGICICLGSGVLLSCEAKIVGQDDVFDDVVQRVAENLLPGITEESEAVLRNLVNLLTAFPQVCATPLANLGSFQSLLPALPPGRQIGPDLDEETGAWEVTWQGVVLGDESPPTLAANVPSVDITVTITFRTQAGGILRAVPFTLAPESTLQTAGAPTSFACPPAEAMGCFFLFQDNSVQEDGTTPARTAGQWTLSWRNVSNTSVSFAGQITAAAVTRVIRLAAGLENPVESLAVNAQATEISFEEPTESMQDKGFTFFVRPGDAVRFQLRIGPEGGDLQDISRNQLRLGPDGQLLPADDDATNFTLVRSTPITPQGEPAFVPGQNLGTFIWQDVAANNDCPVGEDRWRMRFSTAGAPVTFSGSVGSVNPEGETEQVRVTPVGQCPEGSFDDDRNFQYDCPLQIGTTSGYDFCVSSGRPVAFAPGIDQGEGVVREPGLVFIGADGVAPPSPDPFDIFFDIDLSEPQSGRHLEFFNTQLVLRGNSDAEDTIPLNADQVSLDPLCSIPGEQIQPRVRFTGDGDYSTQRFDGSIFTLEDVEFLSLNVNVDNENRLVGIERFPDGGDILLLTRVENEIENTIVTVPMHEIQFRDPRVVVPVDVEMSVKEVVFDYPDANFPERVGLTVE
jgi:hypothetical protein